MNVAYILHSTAPLDGATKAFFHLLSGLAEDDIQPMVVIPDKGGIYQELTNRGINVVCLTYRPNTYPRLRNAKELLLFVPRTLARMAVNRLASRKLSKMLIRHQTDLVHTNVSVINIGYRAAKRAHIPHIYHIREYGDKDFDYHYFPVKSCFYSQLNNSQSYNICITKDIQRYHHQEGQGVSRVIYDSIGRAKDTIPEVTERKYFLFAGRIEPAKGLDLLLQAYADYVTQHPSPPVPLLIAGGANDSIYPTKIKQYVSDHGLASHVTFLGERRDIETLMRNAKAIIIPSRSEGFGLCMPEAMLEGCLAIAHNTGGSKEQLDNGLAMEGQEIALRYNTTEELTQLLAKVSITPTEHYRPYIERAFRTVNALYTVERNARKVYQFYQDITTRNN